MTLTDDRAKAHGTTAEVLAQTRAPAGSGWARTTFVALHHREYRLLFVGTIFAQLGFSMMQVAQGVVAFDLTGKNSAVGLVSLGMGVAMLCLGPFGGALADRLSKRGLLMVSQSVMTVAFLLIGVAIITGLITIWLLVLSSLLLGMMFPIMGPPRQAMIGDMLRGPLLANGVALQQMAMNGTRLVGPFLAGALIAVPFIDTGGTYLVMGVAFAAVVAMLLMMAPTARGRPSGRSLMSDVGSGLRYIWGSPDLRLLTLVFFGVVLTGFSYQTLMPGFV